MRFLLGLCAIDARSRVLVCIKEAHESKRERERRERERERECERWRERER